MNTKNAVMIVIFPSADARTANDLKDAKVFVGFSGMNRLSLESYSPLVPMRGALFFNAEDFREAESSVTKVLNGINTKNGTSQCVGALKFEMNEQAVIWHEAEEFLKQNQE